ncbi:MAG TPA: hypothetical protein VGA49_03635 [Patescibacteria group bacterium]
MNFFEKYNLKPMQLVKFVGLALVGIILVLIAFKLIGSTLTPILRNTKLSQAVGLQAPSFSGVADELASGQAGVSFGRDVALDLSVRNIPIPTPTPGPAGDQAEAFEITEYNAQIETRQLAQTCLVITELKVRPDVIFENANEHDQGCNYTFKVEREITPEILAVIESLNPRDLSENTQTIKRLVDDFTSQIEILERKQATIEATLENAISAYDEITALATQVRDVESLARIIESKINIIERLTQERIYVSEQLDRLSRAKTEQLDRLEYTYFYVNVIENKYIDGEQLKDSWKAALRGFVRDINQIVQDISINLLTLLLLILQYVIYFFILLVVAKYGWKLTQYIWKK